MLEEEDPLIDRDEEHMIVKEKKDEDPKAEFLVKIKEPHSSAFDNEQEEEEKQKERDKERKAKNIDDDEPDYVKDDPYGRSRLHAWVFVQKKEREVAEEFFIEPTTGRCYPVKDSPYFSIQAIFNHENFWINLDPNRDLELLNLDFVDD